MLTSMPCCLFKRLSSKIFPSLISSAYVRTGAKIAKTQFYAVRIGRMPGVYMTWSECKAQVEGFANASYKKFPNLNSALAFAANHDVQIEDFEKSTFDEFSSEEETLQFAESRNVIQEVVVPEHEQHEIITVFTDGACSGNGQVEAKAGIGVYWGPGNLLNASVRLEGKQTNNRAEIFAAIFALRQAKQLGIQNIRLCTDSLFLIKGITKWIYNWKKNNWMSSSGTPIINKEDFMELDKACQGINVDWCYIKGHDKIHGNVEADKLAVAGCNKLIVETDFEDDIKGRG